MAEISIIQRWLIRLGRVTVNATSADDAVDFVQSMAPLLASRYGDEMFTDRSLEHVAAECRFLPTYGELVAHLRDWQASLPAASYPAINDNVVDLDPKERMWLAYYERREAEGFAPLRGKDGRLSRPDVTDWREHALAVVHKHAPRAWDYIMRDEHAA